MEVTDVIDTSYTKYDSEVVAELVGRDNFHKLVVTSSAYGGELVQVNYEGLDSHDGEIIPLDDVISEYRGVVYDTVAKVAVAGGSNYTKKIVHDGSPIHLDDEDYLVIKDVDGKVTRFPFFSHFTPKPEPEAKEVTVEEFIPEFEERVTKKEIAGVNISIDQHVRSGVSTLVRDYAQGTVLMFYQWKYDVHVSTHKRIFGKKSTWISTVPFWTTYQKIGGPALDKLFDPKCKYSPYCYRFLVTDSTTHPTATRMWMPKIGYLTFLGVQKMWDVDDLGRGPYRYSPEPLNDSDTRDYVEFPDRRTPSELLDLEAMCEIPVFDQMPAQPQKYDGFIYYPQKSYSLEMMNETLSTGYHYATDTDPTGDKRKEKLQKFVELDYRLGTGEAIFLTTYTLINGRRHMINTLVKSRAYEYRRTLHGGDRSMFKDMLRYMSNTLKYVDDTAFTANVPTVTPLTSGTLFAVLDLANPDPLSRRAIMTPDVVDNAPIMFRQREGRAAYYFIYTVNPSCQRALAVQWKKYIEQRQELIGWLVKKSGVERMTIDDSFDKLVAAVCKRINIGAQMKAEREQRNEYNSADKEVIARETILAHLNPEREVYNLILKKNAEQAQTVVAKNLQPSIPKHFSGFESWNVEHKTRTKQLQTKEGMFKDTQEYKRPKSQVKTRGKMVNVGGKWIPKSKAGNR